MATISTSIEIYDKVTKPINSMLTALEKMCDTFDAIDRSMDGAFDSSAIMQARIEIDKTAQEMIELGNQTENSTNKQEHYNNTVGKGASAMNGLVKKVAGLVTAYASVQSITKAMDLSDQMTQTTARLDMMNDGLQTTEQLQRMIYQSAQRSRGSYQETADAVAKMGIMAKDSFKSNAELVAFSEQLNKQFTIAGTSQAGISSAMLQLTQAMSSGVLRGEELNSVFEQAPTIIQSIADYLGKPIGSIRAMAAEGLITSEIVKNALLSSAEETNAKFEKMPKTWSQVWTSMKNTALMNFQPVLQKINELANNESIQVFFTNLANGVVVASEMLVELIDLVVRIGNFFGNNWSIIEPIIWGIVGALALYKTSMAIANGVTMISSGLATAKALADGALATALGVATAAQWGLNVALDACPITWIIALVLILIVAIVALAGWISKLAGVTGSTVSGMIGVLGVLFAFWYNSMLTTLDFALGTIGYFINGFLYLVDFLANVFRDPIGSIIHAFGDMADGILSILDMIARAIDNVFGSNLSGAVSGWIDGLDSWINKTAEKFGTGAYEKVVGKIDFSTRGLGLSRMEYGETFNASAGFVDKIKDAYSDLTTATNYDSTGYDASNMPGNIADIAENTGSMSDAMEISGEDLKYLRDIAERDVINRFTTAEIKVEMTNNNNISSGMDLDGLVNDLVVGVNEAMEKAAEGVHV